MSGLCNIFSWSGLWTHPCCQSPVGNCRPAHHSSDVCCALPLLLLQVPLRVSGISPGLVETEFFTVRAYGDEAAAKAVTSAMKCLEPADVANAVLWCLSAPPHMEVNDIVIRPTEQMV